MNKKYLPLFLITLLGAVGFAVVSVINTRIADEVKLEIDNAFDDLETISYELDFDHKIDDIRVNILSSTVYIDDFRLKIDNGIDQINIRFKEFELSTDFEKLIESFEEIDKFLSISQRNSNISENQYINFFNKLSEINNDISSNYYHKIEGLGFSFSKYFSFELDTFILESKLKNSSDFDDYLEFENKFYLSDNLQNESQFVDYMYNFFDLIPKGSQKIDINEFSFKMYDNETMDLFGVTNIEFEKYIFNFQNDSQSIEINSKAVTNFAGDYELKLSVDEKVENIEIFGLIDTSGNRLFTNAYRSLEFLNDGDNKNSFEFEFDGSYEDFYSFLLEIIDY